VTDKPAMPPDEPTTETDPEIDALFTRPRVVGGTDAGDEPRDPAREMLDELLRSCAFVERGGVGGYAQEIVETFRMQIGHRTLSAEMRCVKVVDGRTMAQRYENQRIEIDGKPAKIFDVWKASPSRRQYSSAGYFFKIKPPPGVLNLATVWTVTPKRGSWARMQHHIINVICSGNVALAAWLLDFIGDMFQNPDRKRSVCVVLIGEPGTGKTKLVEWLRALVGLAGLKLDRSGQLVGRFNAHLEGKLIIGVEETALTNGPKEAATLKDLISSPTLTIEEKYAGVREASNTARIFVCTNHAHAVTVDPADRRFLCLEVSNKHARDSAYFEALDDEMADGGAAAMLFDLLHREITSTLDSPPPTDTLARQKLLSLDPLHQAMLRVIESGALRTRDDVVLTLLADDDETRVDCGRFNGALEQLVSGAKPKAQAMAAMRKNFGIENVRPKQADGRRERQYIIPSADRMIRSLAAALRIEPAVIREALGLDDEAPELELRRADR